jgi:hypothetical protein
VFFRAVAYCTSTSTWVLQSFGYRIGTVGGQGLLDLLDNFKELFVGKKKRLRALFSHWVTEPTPENIACHLHEKTEILSRIASPGFCGELNPMEKQVIEHVRGLHQQVLVLTGVVQALLIIEDERISQKIKRAFRWVLGGVRKLWRRVGIPYKILAGVVAVVSLWAKILHVLVWLFHRFWHL